MLCIFLNASATLSTWLAVLRQNKAILHAGHTVSNADEPRHIFSHQQRTPFPSIFTASPKTIFGTMTPARSVL